MRFDCQALLFDIDGTLIDSTSAVIRSWQTLAAEFGIDATELLRVCHGRRSADTIEQFVPEPHRARAADRLDALELADLDDIVALPGVKALLDGLPESRWAAVTSGGRVLMRARLGAAGLDTPQVLVSAEDVVEGKPSPEGFLTAAKALGFDITECIIVEDAPAGVAAGLAAGARVIALTTTHAPADLGAATAVTPDLRAVRARPTSAGLVVNTA